LNNVSGEFRTNQLTAVIGCSGSGKSSLLNVLSGFAVKNVSGVIKLNDHVATRKLLRKYSSYVMQEYEFHPFITVLEAMMFAVNCKFALSHHGRDNRKEVCVLFIF
jgi:ABC-type multidrug transport system ATPase subunit